jgi:RsiW-degrading membrane proteinase PrsW (M82 family)
VTTDLAIHLLLGLLPVCCFLAALVYLDSYKLVPIRRVLAVIALGSVTAALSYLGSMIALDLIGMDFTAYTRYIAPVIEEALKATVIVVLLRLNRIGFLVDAAILGFAVGAGFAILENLYFLRIVPETQLGTWIVRGFGTALMHGGATAIFAVTSHTIVGKNPTVGKAAYLPGLGVAIIAHSVYNHFFLAPIVNTLAVLLTLPLLLVAVFDRSERAVADWLGMGFDADTELLELINSGEFSTSRVGLYLHSLKEKFAGPIVADLLCYLRLHTELSIRAKGLLMMRESGFESPVGEETRSKLEELRYLEGSIGATGVIAMKPFMQMSQKDLWKIYVLSD